MSQSSHPSEPALYAMFKNLGIAFETREHAPIFTVDEGAEIKATMAGGHTKNLFLKDKSGAFALISAAADTVIRLNQLHPVLGMKRLSFGRAEIMQDLLGVTPGSVTVFSVMHDTDHRVRLILDQALFAHEHVWFHPLRNSASTRVRSADLIPFAEATGHTPTILDFATLNSESPKP